GCGALGSSGSGGSLRMAITSPKSGTTMLAYHWWDHVVVANQPPTANTYTAIPRTLIPICDQRTILRTRRSYGFVNTKTPTSRLPTQMAWSCLLVTLLSMTPAMNRYAASTSGGMYLTTFVR